MAASEDYCDLCDLPRSQCIHGRPPREPAPAPRAPRTRRTSPAPRAPAAPRRRTPAVAARPVTRRWSPPEVFEPLILAVLESAGGELEAEDLFAGLAELVGDRLLPGDRERTPQGELRWQYAARRARLGLIERGVMTRSRPGVWQLADRAGGG